MKLEKSQVFAFTAKPSLMKKAVTRAVSMYGQRGFSQFMRSLIISALEKK
jgi:hypothetical protein